MSSEDDDLPVLVQVLRTGNGRMPPFVHDDAASRGAPDASGAPLAGHNDEPAWPRALVIGSDPEPAEDDLEFEPDDRWSAHALTALLADDANAATSTGAGSEPARSTPVAHATVADPRRIDLRANDVFLRTAPTESADADRIDEPPMRIEPVGDGAASVSPILSRDVPLVFRDEFAQDHRAREEFSVASRDQDATFALYVRDSVLQELSSRIDTELDARIAQTLHAELETALAQLQTRLRVELAEALRDVVGHAVDEAIERLRDPSQSNDLR